MADVIRLDDVREVPGTMWWSGWVQCIECGHRHVAVLALPDWAAAPVSADCAACPAMRCCVPISNDVVDSVIEESGVKGDPWRPPDEVTE